MEELEVFLAARRRVLALWSIVAVLVASSIFTACQGTGGGGGVNPNANYEITERFQNLLTADLLGLRVRSQLATGSLSAEQVSQLATFLSNLLAESGQYQAVINLNGKSDTGAVEKLVEIAVTELHPATRQELAASQPSKLSGTLSVSRTSGARNSIGAAKIWATGVRLQVVGKTEAPDTVQFFASAVLELVQ
jgi:hypothetical protein